MSTPNAKPVKGKKLNPKLLSIAALLLVVLALLFLATPLIRPAAGLQRAGNFAIQTNGQPVTQNGSTAPSRPLAIRSGGMFSGVASIIIYFIALLVSLAAAVGMYIPKRWGKVLGIIMAALYGLLGLVSLLPVLLLSALGTRNPLSLILGILHLLLAIAVIVLASIPAKQEMPPPIPAAPPVAST
jgi:hypothetical protein